MGMGMGNDKHVQTKGRPFVEAGRLGRLPDGPDLKAKQVLESCLQLLFSQEFFEGSSLPSGGFPHYYQLPMLTCRRHMYDV